MPEQDLIAEARELAARPVTAGRTHAEYQAFDLVTALAAELEQARARIAELEAPPITVERLAQWLLQTAPVTRENCQTAAERILDLLRDVSDQ